MKVFYNVLLASILVVGAAHAGDADSAAASDLDQLKAKLAAQQAQIEQLRQILADQAAALEKLETKAKPTGPQFPSSGQVASTTAIVPPTPDPTPKPSPFPQKLVPPAPGTDQPAPLELKIGDAYITPIGFMDLTNTWRSTNAGTSLQTNFGSIPYNNTTPGRLTEDKLSAANSRIGFRVDALEKGWAVMGYFEGDFVGGVGDMGYNTQVSSNSLLFRIRQYYVTTRKNKFEFQAGQSWSMITPNRKQISPLPGDLFYSQVVDVNYMNGLTWGRIPGVRFLYHPSDKVTFGLSLENSSQYFGGSGGGGVPTLPTALSASMAGELDQNVTNGVKIPNVFPDIISKIAFDPSSRVHFEIVGVMSGTKLFNPSTQQYFTKVGGGGSVNGNFELVKGFRLVTNNFWSDGEGRYLFGVVPNFIVRADGSPSLIHAGSTLDGFEYGVKNFAFYAYYGGILAGRNTALDANGKTLIGYGYSGAANGHNKTTQEGSFGLTQTLMRDNKWGALQLMYQYAYFFRNPWFVALGAPKNTHENAIWFNMRYTLPGTPPSVSSK
jgi:hypothetical protein